MGHWFIGQWCSIIGGSNDLPRIQSISCWVLGYYDLVLPLSHRNYSLILEAQMVTKPKSNSVVTHEVVENAAGSFDIVFNVLNVGDLKLDLSKLSDAVETRAVIHGMIQRISDAAAISRNPETGKPATAQEKFDRMQQLISHYETGTDQWSRVGSGGGNKGGYLFRALQILYPNRPIDELRAWMDKKSKSEQAALRASPKVRAIIDTFTEDSDIDTDAMLDELDS